MNETREEMIGRLKTNERALCFLLEDPQTTQFLEENWKGNMKILHVAWSKPCATALKNAAGGACYRLRSDFEFPVEGEYIEKNIILHQNIYAIEGIKVLRDGNLQLARLSEINDVPSFCGVKFAGQCEDSWTFDLRQFIDEGGWIDTTQLSGYKPAIPALARFKKFVKGTDA